MSTFKTTNNLTFTLDVKTADIAAVRDNVKYPDGKPVDILEAAETGTLAGIYGDVKTLVDVIFVICLSKIKEYFDVQEYDKACEWEYELHPERRKESSVIKASRWFGSLIDGDVLISMQEAFEEAVINFIPNGNRRQAMQLILGREKDIERLEMEMHNKTVEKMFCQAEENIRNRYKAADTASAAAGNLFGSLPE